MITNIAFSISGQRISVPKDKYIIAESVGHITFTCTFDSEWDGLSKHVIFTNGDVSRSVIINSEGEQLIPYEVLKKGKLYVSFIGLSQNGGKKLTTKKMLFPLNVLEAGKQDGDEPRDYSPALWEQAISAIGTLGALNTSAKTNLVAAINELAAGDSGTSGGGRVITDISFSTRTASGNLYGDVNGDGEIDSADLIMISIYIENGTANIDIEAADVDLDGTVDEDDLELLHDLTLRGLGTSFVLAKYVLKYDDGTTTTVMGRAPATLNGQDGSDGGYYIPGVDAGGTLRWTASQSGMPSVASVNIKGSAGAKGDTGATPHLTVGNVSTLAAGSNATAEITGTDENPVLNLGIPRGADGSAGSGGTLYYGTCSTEASSGAKVVSCAGFELNTGSVIFVKFTYGQTYNATSASPVTMNVNGTGARPVVLSDTSFLPQYGWQAGEAVGFIYDGTNWVMIAGGTATSTYYGRVRLSTATNSTSTTMAATPSAVKAVYELASAKTTEAEVIDLIEAYINDLDASEVSY